MPSFSKNPEKILFDGVLTQIEFAGDLAVAQTFGNERDDLFLARGEQVVSIRVEHPQRRHFRDEFHDVVELFGVGPDLSIRDPKQALTEQAQVGVRDT